MTLLRSALFNLVFFSVTFVMTSYCMLLWAIAPRRLLPTIQAWGRLMVWCARVICGIRVQVIGAEHLPRSGPALIASQHQSAFDTFIWLALVPRVSYVVKAELKRLPMFGQLLIPAGMIAVDRSAGASAIRGLLRDGDAAWADQRQIVIFPEGTRVDHGQAVSLHPGIAALAARGKLGVVPVATDSGRLWGRNTFLKRSGTIHIVVQPPISAELRRDALMQALEQAWREATTRLQAVDKSVGLSCTPL